MWIAVITDTHANLPALQAAVKAIQAHGYDAIYHTGDAIGIGPCPAECLEILIETPRSFCLMGNHEDWLIRGLPSPRPDWMNDDVSQFFQWTYDQINHTLHSEISYWPYELTKEFDGVEASFLHYPLTPSGAEFLSVDQKPSSGDLDRIFEKYRASVVFFGHYHHTVDERGRRRYINPGSLGLGETGHARYVLIDFKQGHFTIHHHEALYDDSELFELYENRKIPGRDRIYEMFFGG